MVGELGRCSLRALWRRVVLVTGLIVGFAGCTTDAIQVSEGALVADAKYRWLLSTREGERTVFSPLDEKVVLSVRFDYNYRASYEWYKVEWIDPTGAPYKVVSTRTEFGSHRDLKAELEIRGKRAAVLPGLWRVRLTHLARDQEPDRVLISRLFRIEEMTPEMRAKLTIDAPNSERRPLAGALPQAPTQPSREAMTTSKKLVPRGTTTTLEQSGEQRELDAGAGAVMVGSEATMGDTSRTSESVVTSTSLTPVPISGASAADSPGDSRELDIGADAVKLTPPQDLAGTVGRGKPEGAASARVPPPPPLPVLSATPTALGAPNMEKAAQQTELNAGASAAASTAGVGDTLHISTVKPSATAPERPSSVSSALTAAPPKGGAQLSPRAVDKGQRRWQGCPPMYYPPDAGCVERAPEE